MKKCFAYLSILLLALSSCLVEEAPIAKEQQLVVFSDKLTLQDSIFIKHYSKKHKIKVIFHQLNPAFIREQLLEHRFDVDVDILLLSNQAFRNELLEQKLLRKINYNQAFTDLNRQFNNTHHFWLPLAHNPLVVAMPKDSAANCRTIYFESWHKKDSLKPQFKLGQMEQDYIIELNKSRRFQSFSKTMNKGRLSNEQISPLSSLVKLSIRKDSNFRQSNITCKTYLKDRKRYITIYNSASIYRYGRNPIEAERFIIALSKYAAIFASNRNQIPCNKKTQQSPKIAELNIQ